MDRGRVGVTPTGGDPGWRPAMRALAWHALLVPGPWRRRAGDLDGLTALRVLFLGFVLSAGLIMIVVTMGAGRDTSPSLSGTAGAIQVSTTGTVALLVVRFVRRSLDGRSDARLAASYRRRLFLRLAFAQAPALVGFNATFLTANPAMYPLGLLFSGAGFALLAPTAAHLEADQQELMAAGCSRSLIAALESGGRPPA